jgi:hypothetical protein
MCPSTSVWYVAWGEYESGHYPLHSGNLPTYSGAAEIADMTAGYGLARIAPLSMGRLLFVRVYRYTHRNGRNPEGREMFTLEVGEET